MTHHSLTQTYPDLNVNGLTDLNGYEWVQYLNNTSTDLKARNWIYLTPLLWRINLNIIVLSHMNNLLIIPLMGTHATILYSIVALTFFWRGGGEGLQYTSLRYINLKGNTKERWNNVLENNREQGPKAHTSGIMDVWRKKLLKQEILLDKN